jgi:putative ABC transport system permease protein
LTSFLTTLLFGAGARDPLTFVAVAGGLLAVTLIAAFVPARRATRVSPMSALH